MKDFLQQYQLLITGGILGLLIFELIRSKFKPQLVFVIGVILFLLLGFTSIDNILNAATNKSILIIFMVISISNIINKYVDISSLIDKIIGKIQNPVVFLLVFGLLVAIVSSVFNNTPIVILLIPYVINKAQGFKISPSKFLIPLSYFAILGGMITIIGTSTNLVLNGLIENSNLEGFSFFDFLIPGLLVTVVGVIFIALFGKYLLPARAKINKKDFTKTRKYFIEAKIGKGSILDGKSISQSRIKEFKGVSLLELVRGKDIFNVAGSRNMILEENDRLIFSGSIEDVMTLNTNENKLELISNKRLKNDNKLEFVELSIPTNSHLDGKKIKETNFRQTYGATVLAVHRYNEELSGRIGEITLRSGDLLIVVPHDKLPDNMKTDFYLLSNNFRESKPKKTKTILGIGIGAILSCLTLGFIDLFMALGFALILLIFIGYTNLQSLQRELNLNLFAILVGSIIIGEVFMSSGLADFISGNLFAVLEPYGTSVVILSLMFFTFILTSFITNVAAVSIAFPLAFSISTSMAIDAEALFLAIAFAASAAFMTPIGYQTNLLVMAPGDYKFKDFMKIGFPLSIIYIFVVWSYLIYTY
ncbi:MAG: hypothetical protein CL868_19960 [Cytophagaceae bacterium]|nr:hypothetical protein [Cytophagaceae bacterium]